MALPYADGASYRRGSLLAALAHGVPVVTTEPAHRGRSLEELVDEQSALLVRPDDTAALARTIGRVLDDKGLAARLSAGARGVAEQFSWDRIAARHLELYRELVAERAP